MTPACEPWWLLLIVFILGGWLGVFAAILGIGLMTAAKEDLIEMNLDSVQDFQQQLTRAPTERERER